MTKSLRSFLMSLGFATYLSLGAGAMAGQAENWLSPVCYHDSPEYGHYRWNCLIPPPPVASEIPVEGLQPRSSTEDLPVFAALPDEGNAPAPEVISTPTISVQVSTSSAEIASPAVIDSPVYFSATDVRRRDWWTPTFVLSDNRPVTPSVVEGGCQTDWSKREMLSGSISENEGSNHCIPSESSHDEATANRLPPECLIELLAVEFAFIHDLWMLSEEANIANFSAYLAASLSEVARWTVPDTVLAGSNEGTVDQNADQDTDAISEAIVASEMTLEGFSTEQNSSTEEDVSLRLVDEAASKEAVGFMAYTCMIPYSLNASTDENSVTYSHTEDSEQSVSDADDAAELATSMQGLARQLDWVGLNILRVADHLDSWANQALIRNRNSNVR